MKLKSIIGATVVGLLLVGCSQNPGPAPDPGSKGPDGATGKNFTGEKPNVKIDAGATTGGAGQSSTTK